VVGNSSQPRTTCKTGKICKTGKTHHTHHNLHNTKLSAMLNHSCIKQSTPMPAPTTMTLIPDIGVPYEPALKYVDLVERAMAVCNTTISLEAFGAEFPVDADDRYVAETLSKAYASNPKRASQALISTKASTFTPASMVLTAKILTEFSHQVVKEAVHIRHLVTNKLLLETESSDARIRLKALELLGKITDVGLFTDKTEVIHTHQSTEDLRERLKKKLGRLIDPVDVVSSQ